MRVDLSSLLVERRYVLVLLTAEKRYSADALVAGVVEIIFTNLCFHAVWRIGRLTQSQNFWKSIYFFFL
jgi:hypothetical protein